MDAKLSHFWDAIQLDNELDRKFSPTGRVEYMSDEQLKARGYNYDHDMWCVGVMTYQLLVGKVPFGGNNEKQIKD